MSIDALASANAEIERLERQVRRERSARLEAERIAEQGLRALYEANRDLDRRVARRTADLETARAQAMDAARAKTEFLANLSHEVGTPLQTIVAAVELTAPLDDADAERLRAATRATDDLAVLFRNLLELAECEVGRLRCSPVPTAMSEIADRLHESWAPRLARAGMLLAPEASGKAEVDPERLEQIGHIFLDNAERFADPGLVRLRVDADGTSARLSVTDSGPGVPEERLAEIFEPFVQLDGSAARRRGGAGIGLALASGLADHMGGATTATNNLEGGLTVAATVDFEKELVRWHAS